MSATLPLRLYKYRGIHENTESIFTKQEIYFANPMQFNDPFDCGFQICCNDPQIFAAKAFNVALTDHPEWTPEQAHEAARLAGNAIVTDHLEQATRTLNTKQSDETNSKVGILSLSARNDDILMWSHYAACHQGICIEFRTDIAPSVFRKAQPVDYRDDYPQFDLREVIVNEQLRSTAPWMLTKSRHWNYEQEWRVLDFENGPGVQHFPETCLSGVIFGCRLLDEEREKVLRCVKSLSHPVALFQAKQSPTQFKLRVEPIS